MSWYCYTIFIWFDLGVEWAGLPRTACWWTQWYLYITACVLIVRNCIGDEHLSNKSHCTVTFLCFSTIPQYMPTSTDHPVISYLSKCLGFFLFILNNTLLELHFCNKESRHIFPDLPELSELLSFLCCSLCDVFPYCMHLFIFPFLFSISADGKCFCETKRKALEMWLTPVTKRMQKKFWRQSHEVQRGWTF